MAGTLGRLATLQYHVVTNKGGNDCIQYCIKLERLANVAYVLLKAPYGGLAIRGI